MIKSIIRYFSPERRIARKLRSAADIAGKYRYQIAFGQVSDIAKQFERIE